jgi:hypothetical protein
MSPVKLTFSVMLAKMRLPHQPTKSKGKKCADSIKSKGGTQPKEVGNNTMIRAISEPDSKFFGQIFKD